MSKSVPIDLNGTLRMYGIKDRAILRLSTMSQSIQFQCLKPFINSKRVSFTIAPNETDLNHYINHISDNLCDLVISIHHFQQKFKDKHGIVGIYIEYNNLVITTKTLNVDTFFDDLFSVLGCCDQYQTNFMNDNMKIIKVASVINEYGFNDTLLFFPKRGKVYLKFNDSLMKDLAGNLRSGESRINTFIMNDLIKHDDRQLFRRDRVLDYNFKEFLRYITKFKCIANQDVSCIEDLRKVINVTHDRIRIQLAPGVSIVDFVVELESIYKFIMLSYLRIDLTKYTFNYEIASIAESRILNVPGVTNLEVENNDNGSYKSYIVYYDGSKHQPYYGLKLKMSLECLVGQIVDDYYMDLVGSLFDINGQN